MGLFGWFKPKWRHAQVRVRLEAIQALEADSAPLMELALHDVESQVRVAAAAKVRREGGLRRLLSASDAGVVQIARERLANVAVQRVASEPLARCSDLLTHIDEQKALAELTLTASDSAVRDAALTRLLQQSDPSQALLATIAIQDAAGTHARRAVAAVARRAALKDIARKAKHADIRAAAQQRLDTSVDDEAKPSVERQRKARQQRLDPIIARVQRLVVSSAWRTIPDEVAALRAEWNATLAVDAALPSDAAFEELCARFQRIAATCDDRVRQAQADETAQQAALARFDEILAALPDDGDLAAAQTQCERVISEMPVLRAAVQDRLMAWIARRHQPHGQTTSASARVLNETDRAALQALAMQAETLAQSSDWRDTDYRFKVLHKDFLRLGDGLPDSDDDRGRFLTAYQLFKTRRSDARNQRGEAMRTRLDNARALVAKIEALAADPPEVADQQARLHVLKELQASWRAIGPIGGPDADAVRERWHRANDAAFAPLRALHEAADWQRFANLAKAETMIAEIDALAAEQNLAAVAQAVRGAQAQWRHLGPLPRERDQEVWQRFKMVCDREYARCQVYFAELDQQRIANLEQKRALVAEIDAILSQGTIGLAGSPADRARKLAAAERIKAIQTQWKAIGPVPREHDAEVWGRFRELCDRFFAGHRTLLDQEQEENLRQKNALCDEVERMAASAEAVATGAVIADRQRWLKQMREVQARWKAIGHVPREQKEPVWQRFKTACDRVYALVKDELAELDRERSENLSKKQALLVEYEALAQREQHPTLDELRALGERWRAIGHVPRVAMDELHARYDDVRDRVARRLEPQQASRPASMSAMP